MYFIQKILEKLNKNSEISIPQSNPFTYPVIYIRLTKGYLKMIPNDIRCRSSNVAFIHLVICLCGSRGPFIVFRFLISTLYCLFGFRAKRTTRQQDVSECAVKGWPSGPSIPSDLIKIYDKCFKNSIHLKCTMVAQHIEIAYKFFTLR